MNSVQDPAFHSIETKSEFHTLNTRDNTPWLGIASIYLLTAACICQANVTLVDHGQTKYRIVLPAEAIPSERYAADELQKYIQQMSGSRISVVSDSERPVKNEILLGNNTHLRSLGLKVDLRELGTDGFVLRTTGNKLLIVGGRPRGTLNGVYTLLEEKLGVRWFTPELEKIPNTNRVQLGDLHEIKLPALENREVFWTEMMRNPDFAARHRLNGDHYRLTDKHGGRLAVYYPFVHSFDMLVPRELYTDHPEYFPVINGKRANGYVQRCLSNPDVLKLSIAKVREWIKEHPEANIISVSQNDTINNCQCDQCKALDDREGSPAASLIRFVNAVAEDIERDYPAIRIDTLAYQYTRKPPKTIRPRHNVIIRLCSIECCFAHSLEACPSEANRKFRSDIVAWQPVAPLLYVWDYTPNFGNYEQPFPNLDAIQPNVQFFVKHNVKGLFEQGNYSPGGFGELGPLRSYLLAKLLWNPETDLKKHTQEFCAAYYGKAAPAIHEYLELMEQQVRGRDVHAHIFDSPKAAYLNADFIKKADQILRRAEDNAATDDTKFRARVAHLPVIYVQLANKTLPPQEQKKVLEDFLAVARKAGISHISEGQSLEDWAKKMTAAAH